MILTWPEFTVDRGHVHARFSWSPTPHQGSPVFGFFSLVTSHECTSLIWIRIWYWSERTVLQCAYVTWKNNQIDFEWKLFWRLCMLHWIYYLQRLIDNSCGKRSLYSLHVIKIHCNLHTTFAFNGFLGWSIILEISHT